MAALLGQSLLPIPGDQACYKANLASSSKAYRRGHHYSRQIHLFVGPAVPRETRRRHYADHRQDHRVPSVPCRQLTRRRVRTGRNHGDPSDTGMRRSMKVLIA